jgi:predicted dehydrogenase
MAGEKDRLKFAIVGCGRISDLHARAYEGSEDAEIFAVCDVNEDVAKKRKEEWGAKKAYTDYEKLLKDDEIDAVELLVPHGLHMDMTVAAAQAKKNISVQKPMATSVADSRKMVEAAKKEGVVLKVFENFVFFPPYVKAKELVESGAIGKLITVRMSMTTGTGGWEIPGEAWIWRLDKVQGGGGLHVFDDGYHKFSQAYDIGGEVEKVFAWIDYTNNVVDSPSFIMWKYKEGERARYGRYDLTHAYDMFINSSYYGVDDRIELVGSEGIIFINGCTGDMLCEPPLVLYREGETRAFHNIVYDWGQAFVDSGRHFFKCLKDGGDPILSGEVGVKVMQFTLAAELSHAEKREVKPEEVP